MTFDSVEDVENFYKAYAHNVGFGVRLGQQKIVGNVLHWKCLCANQVNLALVQ